MPYLPRPSLSASLMLICVAGVLLRVLFLAVVPVAPVSDFARYLEVATSIVNGTGLSVSGTPFISQPPLYPALLGGWLSVFGVHIAAAKALNLLLSTSTLILWAWTCPRAGMRPRWQLASLALLAFHPALVSYTGILGTETLAVFLAVLAFALTCAPMRAGMCCLLGIVLALVALNRPQLLPLPVGIVVGVLLGGLDWHRARNCLVLLVAFVAVLLPWTLRNEALFNRTVPISANSGYVLMVNNNALNRTGNWMPLSLVPLSDLSCSVSSVRLDCPRPSSPREMKTPRFCSGHPPQMASRDL
jgi:4-amino-4-deoxy-L-arabinose transferase-like glycosyltransferase